MIKVTKNHFNLFRKECRRLIDLFELNNWQVYFVQEDIEDRASVSSNVGGYVATITLCSLWKSEVAPLTDSELRKTALHEVLHLLLDRYDSVARTRFTTPPELDEANEEVVRKLQYILGKV